MDVGVLLKTDAIKVIDLHDGVGGGGGPWVGRKYKHLLCLRWRSCKSNFIWTEAGNTSDVKHLAHHIKHQSWNDSMVSSAIWNTNRRDRWTVVQLNWSVARPPPAAHNGRNTHLVLTWWRPGLEIVFTDRTAWSYLMLWLTTGGNTLRMSNEDSISLRCFGEFKSWWIVLLSESCDL